MQIDIEKLPNTALIDTGVFIRFLGERPDDPRSPVSKAICREMINNGKELFIASPTITEVTRHKGQRIPRQRGITVVAFDYLAAEKLGIDGPESLITELVSATRTNRNYIKYDYIIAACAARARANALIAWDDDYRKICASLKITYIHPVELLAPESAAEFAQTEAAMQAKRKAREDVREPTGLPEGGIRSEVPAQHPSESNGALN